LDEPNVRALLAAADEAGSPLSAVEEDHVLALLRDDLYWQDFRRAFEAQRMERFAQPPPDLSEPEQLWLYLALDYLKTEPSLFDDPFEVIDSLYCEFGYPEEIAGLVKWMPPSQGEPSGLEALEQRWERYLGEARKRYDVRD